MEEPMEEELIAPLEEKKVFKNVSEVIPIFGGFGRFQQLLTACFCIMIIPSAFCNLIMSFAALNPPWKCSANSSICVANGTFSSDDKSRCAMNRSDWEFTEPPEFSIVTYFDIYCDKEWMIHLTSSILFIGWGVGAIVLGWISDNYGRKIVLFPSFLMIIAVGFISAFTPGMALFFVFRFIIGFFKPGTSVQSVVLLSEYVNTKYRPHALTACWFFFAIALCLQALKAYYIQNWKILFIVCTVPYLFVLLFFKFIPESVRWIHLHGKNDDMMDIFQRMSYWNNKKLPSDFTILPLEKDGTKQKSTPLDLFRTRRMAAKTLAQGYIWLVNGMVYYGLSMAADDFGGSIYTNFALLSIIEFPANILAVYLCGKIGRKKTTSISMAFGGIACIVVAFVPTVGSIKIFRIILGTFGKLCITISFNVVYTWSLEIYSTDIRAEGMGFLQITSRIGSASSSWVAKALKSLHIVAPFIVMGSLSLIAAISCLILPETKDKQLEDKKEGSEDLAEKVDCQKIN